MDVKKTIPAAVRRTSKLALATSFALVVSLPMGPAVGYALCHYYYPSCSECGALTVAQFTERSALWAGMLCCAALQAAAAALALLIPCCRPWVRRALAHLALAVTMADHYMYAVAVRLLVAADPGFLFGRIACTATIILFAGSDLVCFLGLLFGDED